MDAIELYIGFVGVLMVIVGVLGALATGVPICAVITCFGLLNTARPIARYYDTKKEKETELAEKVRRKQLWDMYWE